MRTLSIFIIVASLLGNWGDAFPQKPKNQHNPNQVLKEILRDSTKMNLLMEQIASDAQLRMKIIQKLARYAKEDEKTRVLLSRALGTESKRETTGILAREILIKFKPGTREKQIRAMAADLGLQQVKAMPQLRMRIFKVPDGKSVSEAIQNSKNFSFVDYVELNRSYKVLNLRQARVKLPE